MLTHQPTNEMIEQWKTLYEQYKDRLRPGRKSGPHLLRYIAERYPLRRLHDEQAELVVTENVLRNDCWREKLPQGRQPLPIAFVIENVGAGKKFFAQPDPAVFDGNEIFVGIDLESGYFYAGSSLLWDELCAFQGLDECDLRNFFCVAQYILALERFDLLYDTLR